MTSPRISAVLASLSGGVGLTAFAGVRRAFAFSAGTKVGRSLVFFLAATRAARFAVLLAIVPSVAASTARAATATMRLPAFAAAMMMLRVLPVAGATATTAAVTTTATVIVAAVPRATLLAVVLLHVMNEVGQRLAVKTLLGGIVYTLSNARLSIATSIPSGLSVSVLR
jgi:hypothetical protein